MGRSASPGRGRDFIVQTIKAQENTGINVSWGRGCDAFLRRALDILASAAGLLLLSPLFLILAWAIKHDSPGPVFYRGPRLGKNGRLFGILKFRTMFERSDSYQGLPVTASGDPRVTPLGRWLRATKLNELPQLWNVLTGEMSLVGPRPEDPEIAKRWPPRLRADLLSVRPGITSPATVVFRSEEELLSDRSGPANAQRPEAGNVMDAYLRTILPDKLRLDSIYIRNRTFLTDLDIIFMTLLLLLPNLRKIQVPETLLFWGPLAQFVSRYLNWFCLDTLVALLSVGAAGLLWRLDAPLNIGLRNSLGIAILAGLCFSILNALLGLTDIQWRRAPANEVAPLALSAGLSTLILALADRSGLFDLIVFHQGRFHSIRPHIPLGMLTITGLLSFIGFTALRFRERLFTGFASQWLRLRGAGLVASRAVGERVLLIGAGNNAQLISWLLTRSQFSQMFNIVGIVDDDPRKQGLYFDGFRVIGSTRELSALVEKHDVGLGIFTISNIESGERQRILAACHAARLQVVILPDLMAELVTRLQSAAQPNQPQQPISFQSPED